MKTPEQLTLQDLLTTIGALESWLDAFEDDAPEESARVRKVLKEFEKIAEQMKAQPGLRLVPKPPEVH